MPHPEDLGEFSGMTEAERFRKEQEAILGHEAQSVLNSDVFRLAFVARRTTLIDQWRHTKPEESARREDLYFELRAIDSIEDRLTNAMKGGKVAEDALREADEK